MKNSININFISIGKAAKLLGVHAVTIRNWEKKGKIVSFLTPGGHKRFDIEELKKLIKRKE